MADKKELLDYLRNQQKAAEIESKVDGINVWVLLGAIGIVAWQLTSATSGRLWQDRELAIHTLVAAVGLHLLSWIIGKSAGDRDELRFSRSSFVEICSPFLLLLKGLLLLLPPAAAILVGMRSLGTVALALIGLLYTGMSISSIVKRMMPVSSKRDKFPKPEFALTRRADVATDLVFGLLLIYALAEQISFVWFTDGSITIEDARQVVLLAALYLLVLIAVGRKLSNDSISWTYELETDLLLDAISPDVAARRIENRRLGPRLKDVFDRFFDDLDQRFNALDAMLVRCSERIGDARQVPVMYPVERAARVKDASAGIKEHIDELRSDCQEFKAYVKKLEKHPDSRRRALFTPVLESLNAKVDAFDHRLQKAEAELISMSSK